MHPLNQQLYIQLYPYRSGTPYQRFHTIRSEILTPLSTLRGIAAILHIYIPKAHNKSFWEDVFEKFQKIDKEFQSLIDQYTKSKQSEFFHDLAPAEIIEIYRSDTLLCADKLRVIAKLMRENEDELSKFLPEGAKWIKWVEKYTEHIWITIDCLTNPDLELSEFSNDWIDGGDI